jgi:hypothetical protein
MKIPSFAYGEATSPNQRTDYNSRNSNILSKKEEDSSVPHFSSSLSTLSSDTFSLHFGATSKKIKNYLEGLKNEIVNSSSQETFDNLIQNLRSTISHNAGSSWHTLPGIREALEKKAIELGIDHIEIQDLYDVGPRIPRRPRQH